MLRKKIIISISALILFLPLYSVSAEIILSSHKYAWSDNIGYINFEDVIVDDDALSGHAWSANKGFINFSPAQGGVLNDGTGNLSGSAWGEQLGWIDFENVSIGANGKFSGTATGALIGTLTFDCPTYCDVETDWREDGDDASDPGSGSSSGGGSGGGGSREIFPSDDETPVAPNNITPSSIQIETPSEIPATVIIGTEPPRVVSTRTESGDSPSFGPFGSLGMVDGTSPLFDIFSEPILYIQKSPVAFIIFSIIAEILILLLIIFLIRRIRTYLINKK